MNIAMLVMRDSERAETISSHLARDRLTNDVGDGKSNWTEAHTFRNQVGIGSESHCLLRQLKRILDISYSDAGLKENKLEGSAGGEGECGDEVEVLLVVVREI